MSQKYRPHEFANKVGVSTRTLRRWDASGKLIAKRTVSNHRYYDETDIHKLFNIKEEDRKTIVYCRVSSAGQKNDLKSQIEAMEQFCLSSGITVDEWIQEIGGGMNFKRKKFLSLMYRIQMGEIRKLLIAHKDRLCRFGFDYFEWMAKENHCEIVIVNQESLSPQQEMVEDLMAIIHTFSCRLYGLRKYKKNLKKAITNENN
ncbi:recombinase [Candidatus Thiomargarita nelsonii]|uniref:Recombinase n=1 Tax=Candidatus Thiomargarita nelsonii TaxID=1003181 RepID=A0A0A6P5X3_9GAMM|nr:recombinase [Candidatus Thiomargarita nelsonii]